jgi:lysophospholipase L1-like esterase
MIRSILILLISALVVLSCDSEARIKLSVVGGSSLPLSSITLIVAHGDSITAGITTCNPVSLPGTCPSAYPNQLAILLGASSINYGDPGAGINCCMGSIDGQTMLVSAPSQVDAYASNPGARLIVFGGTNDIYTVGNPTATYTYFQSYISARLSAGWPANHIIVLEMISRTGYGAGNEDPFRAPWNSLLQSGATTYGYQEIPLASDSFMGATGAWANTTYFLDGTHPTPLGQQIIANDIFSTTTSCPSCPGIH